MTLDDFRRAGLYDPDQPGAQDRLALLEWFIERGFGLDDLVDAARRNELVALAGDRLLRPPPVHSVADLASRSSMSIEEIRRLRTAAGFPVVADDAPEFNDAEADALLLTGAARGMFSLDEALHFIRVVNSSLSRIADAAVSLFIMDVESPHREGGGSELELAKKNVEAIEILLGVREILSTLLILHIHQSIERFRRASAGAHTDKVSMAIGFIDLVGFTPLSGSMPPPHLASIITKFEAKAYDLVAEHGGRVVKLIGDEVMFVTVDADEACRIAASLVDAFDDPDLTPRGGIAYGDLLAHGGDYYGPVVNLASRIADIAVPKEILVTTEVASRAPDFGFEPAGRRLLKGFSEPVELLSLTRSSRAAE